MKVLVLPDTHIPYHDRDCLSAWISRARSIRPDVVVSIGDLVDMYAVSTHERDPRRVLTLQQEITQAREIIGRIREVSPRFVVLEGNHERRLYRYLMRHPELMSLECLTIPSLLGLDDYRHHVEIDGVMYVHGDVVSAQAGAAAHRMSAKTAMPTVVGHTHRLALVHRRVGASGCTWAAESGCLCNLDPDYVWMPDWQHGWVVVDSGRPSLETP